MKKIATSIVICILLSLIFISIAREAEAAKVYVENVDSNVNCDYEVSLWYTVDGKQQKTGPVYLTRGLNHTFDTGKYPPYMLDGSLCMLNHVNFATGRYLMRKWIDKISGDSNWKIEVCDVANSIFNPK